MSEFDRTPVPPGQLKPGRYFAASYAGEHVAGTEFVIGALFVSWGVGAGDVIIGLLIGNLLAVLSWALICAPIATSTRLTLYAYLEMIAGPGFIKLFSIANGILLCVLAGAMITVSASAVRILFAIEPQIDWYPTSLAFVLIACLVGAVITMAAARGFQFVARFAEATAPWLVCIFFVGAIAMFPVIAGEAPDFGSQDGPSNLLSLAEERIWVDRDTSMNIWHVIAIAWGANVAFHGALGDMTILRFARNVHYGWYSAIGMFVGHFGAWLAAGVMGAAAAILLQTPLTSLDAGAVAFQALGGVGILAVIIAGWTTANPTLYRAGLAFQSLNHRWSRERVTIVTGTFTTIIACFPFVFTGLLSLLGIMALILAPIGGIIFAEHVLFKPLGLTRYWRLSRGQWVNWPAVGAWVAALALAAALFRYGEVHVLFLFVPAWLAGAGSYLALGALMGARSAGCATVTALEMELAARRADEAAYLSRSDGNPVADRLSYREGVLLAICVIALLVCFGLAVDAAASGTRTAYLAWLPAATAAYLVAALILVFPIQRESRKTAS